MNIKALVAIVLYGTAFILCLGYLISLEFKGRKRLAVRVFSVIIFFSLIGGLYYGDRRFNYNFEYLDLDGDGSYEYKYRIIDLHSGSSVWSEIFRVEFYNIDSPKVVGVEVYWHLDKRSDSFEPWDYSENIDDWRTAPPSGINNWMYMQGWID